MVVLDGLAVERAHMVGAVGRWLPICERVLCSLFIVWLQIVGVRTHSIVHHILHAAPIALLLFVPPSPARQFTGLLAGYLWVFMLGAVSPMLHNALIRGYVFTHPEYPYTWLAPIAAVLAASWASANAALLSGRPRWLFPAILSGLGLIGLFAGTHPYLAFAFESPVEQTLAGHYFWGIVLLLETGIVLALPACCAFCLNREIRFSVSFLGWQAAYWLFFVAAMVAGLLPVFNR